jgi:hypothetical protein
MTGEIRLGFDGAVAIVIGWSTALEFERASQLRAMRNMA